MARHFSLSASALSLALALTFFTIHALHDQMVNQGGTTYHLTGGEGSVPLEECPKACEYRCSATSHKKPCLFFCNKCCAKCLCVPTGTYGHREECPCYNNWKTQEGGYKCP